MHQWECAVDRGLNDPPHTCISEIVGSHVQPRQIQVVSQDVGERLAALGAQVVSAQVEGDQVAAAKGVREEPSPLEPDAVVGQIDVPNRVTTV